MAVHTLIAFISPQSGDCTERAVMRLVQRVQRVQRLQAL